MDGNSNLVPSRYSPLVSAEMEEAGALVLDKEGRDYLMSERVAVEVYLAMEEVRQREEKAHVDGSAQTNRP